MGSNDIVSGLLIALVPAVKIGGVRGRALTHQKLYAAGAVMRARIIEEAGIKKKLGGGCFKKKEGGGYPTNDKWGKKTRRSNDLQKT